MNVFTCSGNLGRDVKVGQAGQSTVANFIVAVKSGFGDRAQTLWIDCALWGKRAEGGIIPYLTKGQLVVVSGELGSREYVKDGVTQTVLTLNVNEITLAGAKGSEPAPQQQPVQQPKPQQPAQQDGFDDDIPF